MSFPDGLFIKYAYWTAPHTAQGAAVTRRIGALPLRSNARPLPPPARRRLSRHHARKIAEFTTSGY